MDPFARQASRIEERELITWYRGLLDETLTELRPGNHATAVELARLPDRIRGYEQVKHASAQSAREQASDLLERLHRPRLPLFASRP
jgi:indolepyruvate ferredoxin oxidoreductase